MCIVKDAHEPIIDQQTFNAVATAGIKGADGLELSYQLVKADHVYTLNPEIKEVYERNYKVFKILYKSNAAYYKQLNSWRTAANVICMINRSFRTINEKWMDLTPCSKASITALEE